MVSRRWIPEPGAALLGGAMETGDIGCDDARLGAPSGLRNSTSETKTKHVIINVIATILNRSSNSGFDI